MDRAEAAESPSSGVWGLRVCAVRKQAVKGQEDQRLRGGPGRGPGGQHQGSTCSGGALGLACSHGMVWVVHLTVVLQDVIGGAKCTWAPSALFIMRL